ncbi:hypothetical protein LDO31_06440 [Luteimonas sp. XNQY3]|nr:hypothetical protein [Luteimonas sp. XNQY3]MCD9005879.1 hypothetical protein [Luteimonas sp. XNQY3]
MAQGFEQEIERQLQGLEARGRQHLSRLARRAALEKAWTWMWPATLVVPLACLPFGWFAKLDVAPALAAALMFPAACMLLAYRVLRAGEKPDRRAALAFLDHRLDLKDRLETADQFLGARARSGFETAALHEARPWLERALAVSADRRDPAPVVLDHGRWPFALAALLVMGLAFVLQQARWPAAAADTGAGGVEVPAVAAMAEQASTTTGQARRLADGQTATLADAATVRRDAGSGEAAETGSISPAPVSTPAGAAGAQASAGAASEPGQRPEAAPGRPGSAQQPWLPSFAPALADVDARAGTSGEVSRRSGASAESGGAGSQAGRDARADGGVASDDGVGEDRPPLDGSGDSSGSPQDAAGQPPMGEAPGNGASQDSRRGEQPSSRSQRGDRGQGQGQDGQGNSGEGQNGQNMGSDGVKKSRGISGLLLAVPMEDRLAGTSNAGRVSSIGRPAAPTPMDAVPTRAEARGDRRGDAGAIGQPPATAADNRLLRDFFARQRGGGGDGE